MVKRVKSDLIAWHQPSRPFHLFIQDSFVKTGSWLLENSAYKIWILHNPDARRKFLLELEKDLVKESAMFYYRNTNRLQKSIKEHILKIISEFQFQDIARSRIMYYLP